MGSEIRQGPTGERVAANLKRLRGRIPVRELAARLRDVGRPIAPSGITKIEQGTRRVDVDDLVGLAAALEVSPNQLLVDPDSGVIAPEEDPSVSKVVAEQLRKTRDRKGWTQQQLVDRLEQIGSSIDRSAVAKIETGARGITFDEVLAFAVALGVPPQSLAMPRSSGNVQITPEVRVRADEAQSWWRGIDALDPEDQRFFDDSCSDADAAVRREFPDLIDIRRRVEHAATAAFLITRNFHMTAVSNDFEGDVLGSHDWLGRLLEQIREDAERTIQDLDRHRRSALDAARLSLEQMAREEPDRLAEMQRKVADRPGTSFLIGVVPAEEYVPPEHVIEMGPA